ncbi:hypothetical protein ABH935_004359 [Catenulispora sp. GAS73]|uniref:LpqB family beta-propeller domain-containing protein n=1 Tax=Catenulispora sp. GAS73 TaxID=3156269 RepID=UPI0035177BD8
MAAGTPPSAPRPGDAVDYRTTRDPDPGSRPDEPTQPGRVAAHRACRWAAALLALVTLAGAAACAGPPSKGDVRSAPLNQSRNNVAILANEPTPSMPPGLLVTSFLQALTGDQEDPSFSVAQEFLTPEARSKWIPAGSTWTGTTKIVGYEVSVPDAPQTANHSAHPAEGAGAATAPQAAAPTPVGAEQTISVSGAQVAQIDPYGFFQFQTGPVIQQFTLKYLGASVGWRIATPPDFRMIHPDSFKRAYQEYQSPLAVYLPSHGSAAPVTDQVYLTQDSGKVDYTYDALARAVLHGRLSSQDTGLTLARPVTVDSNGLARVTLQTPPPGRAGLVTDVQLALTRTFRDASENQQLLSSTALSQVLVDYPGCTSCNPNSVAPDGSTTPPVYWVCPQTQGDSNAAIVDRPQLSGGADAPAVCPANGAKVPSLVPLTGIQLEKDTPIAVKQTSDSSDAKSPQSMTFVAAVEHSGAVVVLDDKNNAQQVWYRAKSANGVTDLEWDPTDGSLWVVDNKNLYRVQDPVAPGSGDGTPQQIPIPIPDQQVVRFKPSPDGLRAVVVSGPSTTDPSGAAGPQTATMVFIARTGGSVALTGLDGSPSGAFSLVQALTTDAEASHDGLQHDVLQTVTDAAWADGRTVVLLGLQQAGSSTPKLYRLYLDGSQDSTIMAPEDAQTAARHIAAVTGMIGGHASLWTFSDAPGPTDSNTTYSYFKRSSGADSFQESGWSPVAATATAG